MKLICLFATLISFPALAAVINPETEIDSIKGEYILIKEVQGNCPTGLKVEKYSGASVGIYGNQPGDVILQASNFNKGMKVDVEWNPMSGALNGWTHEEATIGKGHLESSHFSRWPLGSKRYSDVISADYNDLSLKFTREYDGRPFNNICFKQICEYSRAP